MTVQQDIIHEKMKTKLSFIVLVVMLSALSLNGQGAKWKFMGEKLVNDRVDHDIIMVTAAKGDLNALQIKVRGASVDFHRVVVVYGSGRRQEIELRHTIIAGRGSRVINLIGHDRVVRSIEFWYDANTVRGRKALVRLYGRR
jgi:hypothetical protein